MHEKLIHKFGINYIALQELVRKPNDNFNILILKLS